MSAAPTKMDNKNIRLINNLWSKPTESATYIKALPFP